MANWSEETKHLPESINGGKQYEAKDRVSREQLNAIVENSFYAAKKSSTAIDTANTALEKAKTTGTQTFVNGDFQNSINFTSDPQEQLDNKINKTVVLWQNPDSTGDSSFSPQTITLSQARTNFTHLIVEWKVEVVVNTIFTQLFKSTGGIKLCYGNGGSNGIGSRDGSFPTDTTITWTGGVFNKNTANTEAIPLRILGVNL